MLEKLLQKTILTVGVMALFAGSVKAYSQVIFYEKKTMTQTSETYYSSGGYNRRPNFEINKPDVPASDSTRKITAKTYRKTNVFNDIDFGDNNVQILRHADYAEVSLNNVKINGFLIITTKAHCDSKIVLSNVTVARGIVINAKACENIDIYLSNIKTSVLKVNAISEIGSVRIFSDYRYHGLKGTIYRFQDENEVQDDSSISYQEDYNFGYRSNDDDNDSYVFEREYSTQRRSSGDDLISVLRDRSGIGEGQRGTAKETFESGPWTYKTKYKRKKNGVEKVKVNWTYNDGHTKGKGSAKFKTNKRKK